MNMVTVAAALVILAGTGFSQQPKKTFVFPPATPEKYRVAIFVSAESSVLQSLLLASVRREIRTFPDVIIVEEESGKSDYGIDISGINLAPQFGGYALSVVFTQTYRVNGTFDRLLRGSDVITGSNIDDLAKLIAAHFENHILEPIRQSHPRK